MLAGLGVTLAAAGCSTAPAAPSPTATATATATHDAATPTPASKPVSSAAAAGLPAFKAALTAEVREHPDFDGDRLVAALRAAGFTAKGMQVTADRTTIGLATPSVQIAVKAGSRCLLGQVMRSPVAVHALLADPIDGRCLVGRTRTITR